MSAPHFASDFLIWLEAPISDRSFLQVESPSLCLRRYMHNIQMLQRAAHKGLPVAVATQSMTDDAER